MMYLVLTALLALQVSSSIIERFQALNENLQASVQQTSGISGEKLKAMHTQVEKGGNKEKDRRLEKDAIEISNRTKVMLEYIRGIKTELIKETGGYDEDGNFKGAKEETQVEVIMIGANKGVGKGYALQTKLDAYQTFMEGIGGRKFPKLAPDGKDDPVFSKHKEQRMKDYANLNYGQTPMVAALATLSETENRIVNMEAVLLNNIAMELGVESFQVGGLVPVVSANSNVVAAGTKYNAHIGLAITGTASKPEMTVGGQNLVVDGNGIGSYSFTASGGNYNPATGTVEKTWTGKVKVRRRDGTDTTYTITEKYTVAQPVIDISSASVQALYRNCGNKLNIDVPALGVEYRPVISAEGATVQTVNAKGQVIVLPTGPTVKLKVSSNGTFIGNKDFKVRVVPRPTIEVKIGGKTPNAISGISMTEVRSIQVKAIADKEFAAALPDDAIYRVTEWTVTFAKGKGPKGSQKFTTENANLGALISQNSIGEGCRVIIEPQKVQRRNYKGQWEEVTNFDKTPFSYTITQ